MHINEKKNCFIFFTTHKTVSHAQTAQSSEQYMSRWNSVCWPL